MASPSPLSRRALLASLSTTTMGGALAGCSSLTGPRRQRWAYSFDGTPNGNLVVTGGTVLLRTSGENEGRLTAVGCGSGKVVWRTTVAIGDYDIAFHEASGTVLVGGPEMLVGLDVTSGKRRFTIPVGTPGVRVPPALTTDEAGFIALRRDGGMVALNTNGGERWRTDVTIGAPVAGGRITTVAPEYDSADGDVTALRGLRAETGESRFRVPFKSSLLLGTVVRGDRVYTATARGGVRCLDASDGSDRWSFSPPSREDLTGPPLVVGDIVYVGSTVRYTDRDYGTVFAVFGPDGQSGYEYRTETAVRALVTAWWVGSTVGYEILIAWVRGTWFGTEPSLAIFLGVTGLLVLGAISAGVNSGLLPTGLLVSAPIFGAAVTRYGTTITYTWGSQVVSLPNAVGMAIVFALGVGVPVAVSGFVLGRALRHAVRVYGGRSGPSSTVENA